MNRKPVEVIAETIKATGFDPLAMTAEQGAEEIVTALRDAGYFIGRIYREGLTLK